MVSKTSNSNGEITIDKIDKVIFPSIGIFGGSIVGVLVEYSIGHKSQVVCKLIY